ncbi:ABC transporter substrate-binding protein [Parafrankia sp. EUN1f]|uniref:ABC transporter substrate-binding protein n=1 Tax=Parafrankia sp. EUN1f TaxID=102897 RepID=UPI0001C43DE6|nr:ABC transporter substrate-binding protein [Parafrankia sp. EUN1f]EFC85748.1 ABC-type branched-chain amino acid transport systems periplasmic component-like protein [Parafrankia sp. EUN1f]
MRAFHAGVEARISRANDEDGGVYGRRVTYVWRDDQSDQSLNRIAADDLLAHEQVFGIIEAPLASGGSSDLLNRKNVPVTGMGTDITWLDKNNIFSWFYNGPGTSVTWGRYLESEGASRAALISVPGDVAGEHLNTQIAASLQASGVQVVKTFEVAPATTSYSDLAARMKELDVDALTGTLLPPITEKLLPELRQAGVRLKVALMPLGYDASSLASGGVALAGASVFTTVVPFEQRTPGQLTFLDAMNRYSPEIQPPTQDSAAFGWISADLFLRGMVAAGRCPTRESFIAGLRAVTNYDGAGMTPEGSIDLSTNFRVPTTCFAFIQISADDSRFIPKNDGRSYCGTVGGMGG